jgi:hypothetical protein
MKIVLLLLLSIRTVAQVVVEDDTPPPIYEEALVADDNNAEDGASLENLLQYTAHPLNLNTATAEELTLLALQPEQVANILQHRSENGNFISKYELQTVEGMDPETIKRIVPLLLVKAPSEVIDKDLVRRIRREGENYILLLADYPFKRKRGFHESTAAANRFQGSPERLLIRYRTYRPGDFSVGITAEKDQGEKLIWNPKNSQAGFDHLSFHAQLMNKGTVNNVIIGDFQCQFGQGLVWGGAIGFGKGAETISAVRKANIGIVPYTSAYEAGYFRGTAATLQFSKNIFLTGIFSSVLRDGNEDHDQSEPIVGSLSTTGLHRSENEMSARKTVRETIAGGVAQFKKRNFDTGVAVQNISYDIRREVRESPYNQFAFRGRSNLNASAFLNYNLHNVSFFSELAGSFNGGMGYTIGALMSLGKKFELSILHRNYERNFYPFYANAFSENTTAQNERGIYWGWKYRFTKRYSFNGYIDFFEFPWLKSRTYSPSKGLEILLKLSWQPSRNTIFFVQARQEDKQRNNGGDNPTYTLSRIRKRNYWISFEYVVSPQLKMKTRLQASQFRIAKSVTSGFLLFHDAVVTHGRWKITGRYALFDTDDYDNRLYAYENDVWMAYSLPAYYGKGTRQYVMVQYKVNKALTCWLRYGHIRYLDVESVGSGSDTIDGNVRNEIKFETRLKF